MSEDTRLRADDAPDPDPEDTADRTAEAAAEAADQSEPDYGWVDA